MRDRRARGTAWLSVCAGSLLACQSGCSSSDAKGEPTDAASADAIECATTCSACAADESCITTGSFQFPIEPACLSSCSSTSDCAAGDKCIDAQNVGTYCISSSVPAACGGNDYAHCDFFSPASCRNATTLAIPTSRFGVVCGFELVGCANLCISPESGAAFCE